MDGDAGKVKRYRDRAAEMRAEAETMTGPETRKMLLDVAASYETLANMLAANEARRRPA
jgi:hypothetical protein